MADNITNMPDVNNIKDKTYHRVLHSFKPEIIVPIAAITNNIDFIINARDCQRLIMTSDDVECLVESFNVVHMCQLEDDIKKLYGMEPWPYVMRWFRVAPQMHSMEFVKMRLKRLKD